MRQIPCPYVYFHKLKSNTVTDAYAIPIVEDSLYLFDVGRYFSELRSQDWLLASRD